MRAPRFHWQLSMSIIDSSAALTSAPAHVAVRLGSNVATPCHCLPWQQRRHFALVICSSAAPKLGLIGSLSYVRMRSAAPVSPVSPNLEGDLAGPVLKPELPNALHL